MSASFKATFTGPLLVGVYNWKDGPVDSLNVNFIDNIRIHPSVPDFSAQPRKISAANGGASEFTLQAGTGYAFSDYIILSGATGTWPGFLMNKVDVPLNPDPWTWTAIGLLNTPFMSNFMGQLDATGGAKAVFNVPGSEDPQLMGLVLYFDYLLLGSALGPPVKMASHPIHILFVP